jgi:hypothetical protein
MEVLMKNEVKLTTVKLLKHVYSDFKKSAFDTDFTLQRLVNRSIQLYNTDDEYRKMIEEYTVLHKYGGQF